MPNIAALLEGIASSVANQVGGAISSVLSFVTNGIENDIVKPATSGIDNVLNSITGSVGALEKAASTGIQTTLTAAANGIGTFISSAESGFTQVLGGVESGISSLGSAISGVFQQVVAGIESGFTAITGAVGQALASVGQDIEKGIADFTQGVSAVFAPIFHDIASFLAGIPHDLEVAGQDIVKGIEDVAGYVGSLAKKAELDIKRYVPGGLLTFIKDIALGDYVDAFKPFMPQFVKLLEEGTGIDFTGEFGVAMGRIASIASAEFAIGSAEEFFPGAAFIMARLLNHIADSIAVGDFRALQQAGNLGSPNMVPGLAELVRGKYRGNLDDAAFYDGMGKSGFTKENADLLYKNSAILLGVNELVGMYKRGLFKDKDTLYAAALRAQIPKDQVDIAFSLYDSLLGTGETLEMWRRGVVPEGWATAFDDLIKSGFTQERIDAIKQISYRLPSVFEFQDFIARMVDDQTQVDKFQLDYGINDEYMQLAFASGYDEKTAKRIYRSYWNLPPFFLLASEFKAGKIDEATFRDALAFQRYTPYWIDKFADQLKPTLTQADIKDMYKYEVIAASQIVPMLTQIGTTKDLAEQLSELWQASVKLASSQDQTATQASTAALKGETKGLIVTAYKDSILTSDAAVKELEALGDTQEAAGLRLAIADHELTQANIKDVFATDKENYLAGNITIEQVLTDLAQAGATIQQQNKYHTALQYAGRSKPKMPSLAELEKWFKSGLLTAKELADAISLLGYADTWIPYFLVASGASASDLASLGFAAIIS